MWILVEFRGCRPPQSLDDACLFDKKADRIASECDRRESPEGTLLLCACNRTGNLPETKSKQLFRISAGDRGRFSLQWIMDGRDE